MTPSTDTESVLRTLREDDLDIVGQLVVASNATLLCRLPSGQQCVYKPVAGERPLWDFPTGTLADREVAAFLVSEAARWHLVPPTVYRDGPFGPGMCQLWMSTDGDPLVDLVAPDTVRDGWLHVLEGFGPDDKPVQLIHADDIRLRRLALFDIVVNNADRKGGHVVVADQRVCGVDHGVCFHTDDKLRTVLWGWSGESLNRSERSELRGLRTALAGPVGDELGEHLSGDEVLATVERLDALIEDGRFPSPYGRLHPIPWPAF